MELNLNSVNVGKRVLVEISDQRQAFYSDFHIKPFHADDCILFVIRLEPFFAIRQHHTMRLKFSILNLLLILTAVAAILGVYSSRQAHFKTTERYEWLVSELNAKQMELIDQNKKLRQELGALTVEDPDQIYAVRLRTTSPKTWSFRVYLPDGADYYFACQINS